MSSEVKRWNVPAAMFDGDAHLSPMYRFGGGQPRIEVVLASDYDALKAERDTIAVQARNLESLSNHQNESLVIARQAMDKCRIEADTLAATIERVKAVRDEIGPSSVCGTFRRKLDAALAAPSVPTRDEGCNCKTGECGTGPSPVGGTKGACACPFWNATAVSTCSCCGTMTGLPHSHPGPYPPPKAACACGHPERDGVMHSRQWCNSVTPPTAREARRRSRASRRAATAPTYAGPERRGLCYSPGTVGETCVYERGQQRSLHANTRATKEGK